MQVGQTVQHFSNAETLAIVVAVRHVHPCGEFGDGNWLRGAFMSVPVVRVRFPNGMEEETFSTEWLPA